MKKLLLVALLALGVNVASHAQGFQQRTPAEQVDRLKTQITGITDDQTAKLVAIYTASAKRSDSLRAAANGDFQSMAPKMQEIRTAQSAKVKAILTADQQKQFDAIPQRGPGGGPGGPGGGAPGGGAPRN